MNAPQPIAFITNDGKSRTFSLKNSRLLRILQKDKDEAENAFTQLIRFLWITCDNREDVKNEEDFVDLFPLDMELISGLVKAVNDEWSASSKNTNPENERFRPTKAEIQLSDGSGSSPSGESTSEASTNSGN